ncbi:hypothetical protein ACFL0V_03845 [Nanoarchaeota archaeon]
MYGVETNGMSVWIPPNEIDVLQCQTIDGLLLLDREHEERVPLKITLLPREFEYNGAEMMYSGRTRHLLITFREYADLVEQGKADFKLETDQRIVLYDGREFRGNMTVQTGMRHQTLQSSAKAQGR